MRSNGDPLITCIGTESQRAAIERIPGETFLPFADSDPVQAYQLTPSQPSTDCPPLVRMGCLNLLHEKALLGIDGPVPEKTVSNERGVQSC